MTRNKQIATKNHYVPVFYTKRWAGPDGRVCQFSKPNQNAPNAVKAKRVHPDATGFKSDLYSLKGVPTHLVSQFEDGYLKATDDQGAKALAFLETGARRHEWSPKLRTAWSRFILTFMQRIPEDIDAIKAMSAEELRTDDPETAAEYQRLKRPEDPPTFAEWVALKSPETFENAGIRIAKATMDHAKIGQHLNDMHWHVIGTDEAQYELLTSDRAIYISGRLIVPRSYVMMPIAPRRLFLATSEPEYQQIIGRLSVNELTRRVNRLVVGAAVTYAYGTSDRQLPFVQRRMGSEPRPSWIALLHKLRQGR